MRIGTLGWIYRSANYLPFRKISPVLKVFAQLRKHCGLVITTDEKHEKVCEIDSAKHPKYLGLLKVIFE